uniref:Cytochrome P450 n=1 Tax=Oryza punctata TaxID=4537 RepID=A0A0E0LQE5_ORYPU
MLLHLGSVPTLVVSSPRAAEAVLRMHDLTFASRPRSMVTDIILYGALDSCFAPYSDHFRNVKKVVTVHLLNSKKVQAYRHVREEEMRLVMSKLHDAAAVSAAVDISELLQSFANDLICRAVSGKFLCEEGRNKVFRDLMEANSNLLGGFNLEAYFPGLARVHLISKLICARAMRIRRRWDQLLDMLIDDHVSARGKDDDDDFIHVLLSLQDEYGFTRDHIKAISIDMFEAGTDTSHLVLEYAMVELMRNPHILAKLQDEVRSITPKGQDMVTEDNIVDMVFLKAVIKETLRLHPPGGVTIPHLAREDCNVDGHMIPAGTRVLINLWALGRDANYWDKPDEFLPERFMDGSTKSTDFKGQDFQFLPFGSGRRMCPGIHSAKVTLEIMLANLIYCFNWKLPSGMNKEDIDMTDVFGLAIHRKEKLFLVPQLNEFEEAKNAAQAVVVFFLLPLALLFFLLHHARSRHRNTSHELILSKLPSPPFKLPLIGHLHLIGSLPYVSLRDLAAKHGPDLMLLHLGSVPTLVVSSPRAAEAVLRMHDLTFASRPRSMVTDIILYGALDSCFAPYSDHFRNVKKVVTVHLLNSKKVQAYRHVREEEVRLVMSKLHDAAAVSAAVDISELLQSFANDLICRAVSGKFLCEEGRNKQSPGRVQPGGLRSRGWRGFASRPRSMVTDIILYGALDSCFAPYSDHFRNVKKVVTVHLLNSKKVQAYRLVREEEVRLVMSKLHDAAAVSAAVDISELLQSFANDLICRAVSGKFLCEEGRNKVFRDLMEANSNLLGGFNLEAYFPGLARVHLISKLICARAMRIRRRWDQLLDMLIDDHVLARGKDNDDDFIHVLLSLQDEYGFTRDHIKAISIDMFEAGTDTSHLVLEYAMVELMRNPCILAKLQDEVRSITPKGQDMVTEDNIVDMVFLKAVIKETLRLHPPGGVTIPHLAREDCNVGGHMIPEGTRVLINLWALNRDANYWDKPDEFLPERFMDGSNKSTDFKGQDFQFLPFGSGRRMCPGIHSAKVTLEIMLANLIYCFNWKLPSGMNKEDIDMTDVFGLTIHRKEKLFLVPQVAN